MKTKKVELWELQQMQNLPLEAKVKKTEIRIVEFVEKYGIENVYISFSGGKDSTVLLDIARRLYPNIKAVFLDTWLEYPQIRQFVSNFSNVVTIKPDKSLKQIIEDDGWCFPSKDVAEAVEAYRRGLPWAVRKLNGLDKDGNDSEYRQQYKKWLKLAENCPEKISSKCCYDQKELPVKEYEKFTGEKPILALMACESARRKEAYLRTGCNSFDGNRPMSKPMGFWTEQDVLEYCISRNIKLAEPYGDIVPSNCKGCKYKTTGEDRTGCIYCLVGANRDDFKKIERVKGFNPKLYDYVMEELGMARMIEWVRKNYPRR